MTREPWLRCTVSEGQFSTEYGIAGREADGQPFSLFAPEEYVEPEREPTQGEVPGWLRITVLKEVGDRVLIRLPRHTFENGMIISVPREDLSWRNAPQRA